MTRENPLPHLGQGHPAGPVRASWWSVIWSQVGKAEEIL